ncbi:Protein zerknuellt [Eumeta japonica]|uniref:Protein zerknuellt n=1 Tax=Eumeta variegata TaxID=151549 RepID=A0A4C1VN46_EUMVA|nr:Protein zerknuellt [Eumeta japonica]
MYSATTTAASNLHALLSQQQSGQTHAHTTSSTSAVASNNLHWNRTMHQWNTVPLVGTPATTVAGVRRKPKRIRTAFTGSQAVELENEFQKSRYIDRTRRIELASRLSLKERVVKIWYQNRRMRDKKEKSEGRDSTYTESSSSLSNWDSSFSASSTDSDYRLPSPVVSMNDVACNYNYNIPYPTTNQYPDHPSIDINAPYINIEHSDQYYHVGQHNYDIPHQYYTGQYGGPPGASAQSAVQAPPLSPVQRPNEYGEDGLRLPRAVPRAGAPARPAPQRRPTSVTTRRGGAQSSSYDDSWLKSLYLDFYSE